MKNERSVGIFKARVRKSEEQLLREDKIQKFCRCEIDLDSLREQLGVTTVYEAKVLSREIRRCPEFDKHSESAGEVARCTVRRGIDHHPFSKKGVK